MRRSLARIKGMGFLIWNTKHELFHILLGLMWAWVLREIWKEFNLRWILTAMWGSVLPDVDHLLYFFTYGKRDTYSKYIRTFLREREWRMLWTFIAKGHKYNTNLALHNYYIAFILFAVAGLSYLYDWRTGVVLFGAMITHYGYDIIEDLVLLGRVNPNWKRLGRGKDQVVLPPFKDLQ